MDENSLPYFHGALMDQDVDTILQVDGDFLIQTKHIPGSSKPRWYLAVKVGKDVKRIEIKRSDSGTVKLADKSYSGLKKMIDSCMKEPLVHNKQTIPLRKPISKGKFQLTHPDIKMMKKIGSGAYGTVYRGLLIRDSKVIAIKKLDSDGADDEALAEMMKEARVMQLYDHKNIVRFYGFIVDRMPYLLVMEYCEGGSVEDKLRAAGKRIAVGTRVDMVAQAATGLEYLHSKQCIHRDIACRNCLLDKGTIKLADFGMCRMTSVYKVDISKPLNVRWLAPEVWNNGETRYNTDIYAFGVMIWEMFEIPYNSPYSEWKAAMVKQKVMAGYRMQPSEHMPDEMVPVLDVAWNHIPEKRPTATGLRKICDEINKKINPSGAVLLKAKGQSSRSQISKMG